MRSPLLLCVALLATLPAEGDASGETLSASAAYRLARAGALSGSADHPLVIQEPFILEEVVAVAIGAGTDALTFRHVRFERGIRSRAVALPHSIRLQHCFVLFFDAKDTDFAGGISLVDTEVRRLSVAGGAVRGLRLEGDTHVPVARFSDVRFEDRPVRWHAHFAEASLRGGSVTTGMNLDGSIFSRQLIVEGVTFYEDVSAADIRSARLLLSGGSFQKDLGLQRCELLELLVGSERETVFEEDLILAGCEIERARFLAARFQGKLVLTPIRIGSGGLSLVGARLDAGPPVLDGVQASGPITVGTETAPIFAQHWSRLGAAVAAGTTDADVRLTLCRELRSIQHPDAADVCDARRTLLPYAALFGLAGVGAGIVYLLARRPARRRPEGPSRGGDRDPEVFLAFAGPDKDRVQELYEELVRRNLGVFFSERSIRAGDPWARAITRALRSAPLVAVLLSDKSLHAYYQSEEIARAIQLARSSEGSSRIVPVYMDGAPSLSEVPYGLSQLHAIDARGMTAHKLAGVLARLLDEDSRASPSPSPRESSRGGDSSHASTRSTAEATGLGIDGDHPPRSS